MSSIIREIQKQKQKPKKLTRSYSVNEGTYKVFKAKCKKHDVKMNDVIQVAINRFIAIEE